MTRHEILKLLWGEYEIARSALIAAVVEDDTSLVEAVRSAVTRLADSKARLEKVLGETVPF